MRLLDSDTCIHIMRGNAKVLQRLYECDSAELRFSVATLFELFGGVVVSIPEHLTDKERKLSKFRQLIQMAEFGPAEAYKAAKIKAELKGQLIGPYDLLLAATARGSRLDVCHPQHPRVFPSQRLEDRRLERVYCCRNHDLNHPQACFA